MERTIELRETYCAICGTPGNSTELYPANFTPEAFSPEVFSARRLPDRLHYRLVKCRRCGLVRSDPVVESSILYSLYAQSTFEYESEIPGLNATYGRYLSRADRYVPGKGALLEIGSGNGFFLEQALDQGYVTARGVEPGEASIAKASASVRPFLVCDVMRQGLFPDESFDIVCLFQVFDHLPDPSAILDACWSALKPGGVVLCLNHDIGALSASLMRERSPIVDIEHTYLYSRQTLTRIFEQHRFRQCEIGAVLNNYSLNYTARLLPIPAPFKQKLLDDISRTPLGARRVWIPLGNQYLIARKLMETGS